MARFNRILLKLSGESLMGKQGYGIDPERLSDYAKQIKEISEMGVQIGIVIGGGNIFRGLSGSQKGFDRVKGDQMGMCATVINSLALSSALGAIGVKNKVLTAIRMEPIGEFYTKWKAIEAMEAGYVCIFSAGTGSPYFTTDTGSSLRGIEIEADVMLKGTRVDGVYTADPEKDPTATKFDEITYKEVLARGLKVMDLTAICMCQDNNLPIYVFNMDVVGNLKKVMDGEQIGTLVHNYRPQLVLILFDLFKLYVFALFVVEDLALVAGFALIVNPYITVRSHSSAGSFFFFLLVCLFFRFLCLGFILFCSLLFLGSGTLEVVLAERMFLFLLFLFFLFQMMVMVILHFFSSLLNTSIRKVDHQHDDDGDDNQSEDDSTNNYFHVKRRFLVMF